MAVRPANIWQTEPVATLYRDIEDALHRYEAYCLEAEARCPNEWRQYWREEAASATRTRLHLVHRLITFLEYVNGKQIQVLGRLHEDELGDYGYGNG
jgi:hypothetical protein